jgi:hypothetical protein
MAKINFVLIFFAGVIAVWLVRMVIAVRRSRMAPLCWYCGASKVAQAQIIRPSDYLPRLSLLVPLRCLGCLTRFYGVRGVLPATRPAPTLVATMQKELVNSSR